MRKRAKKPEILSPRAVKDIKLVAVFRLFSLVGVGLVLAQGANWLGAYIAGAKGRPSFTPLLIVGWLLALVLPFSELFYGGRAALDEEKRLRRKCVDHFFKVGQALREEERLDSGRLVGLLTDNIERATLYRNTYSGASFAALLMPVGVALYLFVAVDWVIGLGLLVLYPLIPVGVKGFMSLFAGSSADSRKQRARLSSCYLDAIQNLVTIRLLAAGSRVEKELREEGEKNRRAIMRLLAGNQVVIIVLDGLFSLLLVVGAFVLTWTRYDAAALTPSQALQVVFLSILLLEPLQQLAGFFYIGMGGMASQKALRAFLATQPVGYESPSEHAFSQPTKVAPGYVRAGARFKVERGVLPSEIRESGARYYLSGVRFDYGRGDVLKGVNLQVMPGQRVAIVGASGGGKSTLLGLLRGELFPTSGVVALDGVESQTAAGAGIGRGAGVGGPLHADECEQLLPFNSKLAYVAQSTWLFTGTIRDNLLLACKDATEEQLWQALEQANLADEIRAMREGLDTNIGEQGNLISGGQAQRLSLARAFLSGRDLLLLDEPTAQVDLDSQAKLIDSIAAIGRDTTIVFVTHRLELLQLADKVYRLENGILVPADGGPGGPTDGGSESPKEREQMETVGYQENVNADQSV